ncbi:hypothetical protein AAFF_G00379130 [Aldrovandia affinis]|uniref:Uncharacterized protein n=1 Tax=Aldrovandia affinis TaxID=143900 RepID=A0AAD7SFG4_9TELE|nr:hypothetical protein AAFF_G00379130 [Aldrovandia affinis]
MDTVLKGTFNVTLDNPLTARPHAHHRRVQSSQLLPSPAHRSKVSIFRGWKFCLLFPLLTFCLCFCLAMHQHN